MIYLDAGATTLQKPPAVALAVQSAMRRMATPGRGGEKPTKRRADTGKEKHRGERGRVEELADVRLFPVLSITRSCGRCTILAQRSSSPDGGCLTRRIRFPRLTAPSRRAQAP